MLDCKPAKFPFPQGLGLSTGEGKALPDPKVYRRLIGSSYVVLENLITIHPSCDSRTKHLNIDCHYVRDKVAEDFLKTVHVKSQSQLADLITKSLEEL
ncbi:hypothetical protein V2J09_001355 [Rumex salicifolius]